MIPASQVRSWGAVSKPGMTTGAALRAFIFSELAEGQPYSVDFRPEGPILVDFSARSADFSTHIQWRQGDTAQPYFHIQWSATPVGVEKQIQILQIKYSKATKYICFHDRD